MYQPDAASRCGIFSCGPRRISRRFARYAARGSEIQPLHKRGWRNTLCFVFGNVFPHHALVTLQPPLMIRTISEPLGNTHLGAYLTGGHGDPRLLTCGNDFLQTQLAVAENSDKSNKHGNLRW
jgi:hypothetical protein